MNDCEVISGSGVVEPFESPPAFFGGFPNEAGAANKISLQSVYGRLPRPATIAPPWSMNPATTDEAVRIEYSRLSEGYFYAEWKEKGQSNGLEMIVTCSDREETIATAPVITLFVKDEIITNNENRQRRSSVSFGFNNEDLRAALSVKEKMRLSHRLMHLYLRSHGATMPFRRMDDVCCVLSEEYIRKQWYEGLLDICIIWVDIAINCDGLDSMLIGLRLKRIGEALESLGRFVEAAQIYVFAVERYCRLWKRGATLYDCAGLAFKRADAYKEAEAAYITALHMYSTRSIGGWDTNDPLSTVALTNTLMLYYRWAQKTSSPGRLATDTEKMERCLSAILFYAGFKAGEGGRSQFLVMKGGPTFGKLVKRNVRTRAGATYVLEQATASPSVAVFRREILSCMISPDVELFLAQDDTQIDDIEGARQFLGEGEVRNRNVCGNPSCAAIGFRYGPGAFRACPCQALRYCSKDCQVVHWKSHKTECRWHQEKKEKKKGAKKK